MFLLQIIWKRKRDRRWGLWRRKLNTASVGTNWSGVLWILSIRISVTFLDPDFCDFSWSGFLWLFLIWISVTFHDLDFCDFYWSGYLWPLFIQISVNFIYPDFCDFYWSGFLWLFLIWISVAFTDQDFCDLHLSGFLWILFIQIIVTFIETFYQNSFFLIQLLFVLPDWNQSVLENYFRLGIFLVFCVAMGNIPISILCITCLVLNLFSQNSCTGRISHIYMNVYTHVYMRVYEHVYT